MWKVTFATDVFQQQDIFMLLLNAAVFRKSLLSVFIVRVLVVWVQDASCTAYPIIAEHDQVPKRFRYSSINLQRRASTWAHGCFHRTTG